MKPTIQQIVLKRFRSVPSDASLSTTRPFSSGATAQGRQSRERISFLAEAMASPLQAVFDKAGGISAVRNRSFRSELPAKPWFARGFRPTEWECNVGYYAFEVKALPNYGFSVVREQCSVSDERGISSWFDRVGAKPGRMSGFGLRSTPLRSACL